MSCLDVVVVARFRESVLPTSLYAKATGLYKTENPTIAAGFLCKYTKSQYVRYTFSILEYCPMNKMLSLLLLLSLFSCESDDDNRRNPFLIDLSFRTVLNTDLPQYSPLNFDATSVVLPNQGIGGIVIYRVNSTDYRAFELSDPNHSPSSCSSMTITGIVATCGCPDDNNTHNIVTGQHLTDPSKFPMKPYRITRSGNTVVVSN